MNQPSPSQLTLIKLAIFILALLPLARLASVTVNGDLCPVFCAGSNFVCTKQGNARRYIFRAEVQVYRCPVFERRLVFENANPGIKAEKWGV